MTRKEFLRTAGTGAAFALTVGCFCGCAKQNLGDFNPDGGEALDIKLDLTLSENASLLENGGYVIVDNKVVVAKAMDGSYVAATRTCSHDPLKKVKYKNNEWYCTEHGARFSLGGAGLNNKGSNGLTVYNTQLSGQHLHVYS